MRLTPFYPIGCGGVDFSRVMNLDLHLCACLECHKVFIKRVTLTIFVRELNGI